LEVKEYQLLKESSDFVGASTGGGVQVDSDYNMAGFERSSGQITDDAHRSSYLDGVFCGFRL
jgi:hypothetical protein